MLSSTTFAEPVNGSRDKLTVIGRVHLAAPITQRISYETASWYTLVEVPTGTYDVVLREGRGTSWVHVQYAGTITDEHFVNRVFTASSVAPKRNIGQPRTASTQGYAYQAAESFATNPAWEIAEDWSIESTQRSYQDGREYTAYSLHRPDGSRVF